MTPFPILSAEGATMLVAEAFHNFVDDCDAIINNYEDLRSISRDDIETIRARIEAALRSRRYHIVKISGRPSTTSSHGIIEYIPQSKSKFVERQKVTIVDVENIEFDHPEKCVDLWVYSADIGRFGFCLRNIHYLS